MKNFLKITAFLLVVFSANLFALSAKAVDAIGNASVTIATPIAITPANQMNFGVISSGSTSGTVATATGAVTGGVSQISGTIQSGTFNITGQQNSSYTLSSDSSVVLSDGSNNLTASLTSSSSGSFDSLGSDIATVNGVLTVGANQAAGSYVGTYTITANY